MDISRQAGIGIASGLVVAAVLTFGLVFTRAAFYAPEPEVVPSAQVAAVAAANVATPDAHPAHIAISAIGVDASVEQLGVTTGDRMAMPSSFSTVGWYKYGPVPGAVGTAVMYGHLDNGLGLSGVFKNLHKLAAGDEVVVTDAGGEAHTFVVDRVEQYQYQSVPAEALEGVPGDTGTHLNLVTCAGGWIYDSSMGMTYDHRLVVYTTEKS